MYGECKDILPIRILYIQTRNDTSLHVGIYKYTLIYTYPYILHSNIFPCTSTNGMPTKRFCSHYASSLAEVNTMDLNFVVECEIEDCFLDFQDTTTRPNMNIQPLVNPDST